MKNFYLKSLLFFFLTVTLVSLNITAIAQTSVGYSVTFRVFHDSIANCVPDSFEENIPGVRVKMELLPSGRQIWGFNDVGVGYFGLGIVQSPYIDTLLRVYTVGTSNLGGCNTIFEFPIDSNGCNIPVEFAIQAGQCPQLGVDISGNPPRPCFDRVYNVRVFNQGLSLAQGVYVDVKLDSNLLFQTSSLPGIPLPNHTWRFQLYDIEPLATKLFSITYQLDCAFPPGQIICSEAIVYPDTVCVPEGGWSGANVLADALCDGDSVIFTLSNNTGIPTSTGLDYIIAEDLIMFRQDVFQLDPLDSIRVAVPANGATWHLSAQQEPGYPYYTYTNATIEGCGTNPSGAISTGVFLQYPYSSGQVNRGEDCQEAVSSYDPNDKQAFPAGFGSSHFIRAGDEIKYKIRFQNTGTDTAYTVVVREQLPQGLDPNSVVAGASSHPYDFATNQNEELVFIFSNINLPDSLANADASSGYLTYSARALPDLPDGSIISSAAKIFFDFNQAIVTNTVFHTIGQDFVKVEVNNVFKPKMDLVVFPNPSTDLVHFSWDNNDGQAWQVKLFDVLGKSVKTIHSSDNMVILPCRNLLPGLYYFQVNVENQAAASGKVIVK
jgi:uncharacterized repeat protein (TIGR01451 family)